MKKRFLNRAFALVTALAFISGAIAQQKTTAPSSKKPTAKNRYLYVENDHNSVPGQKIINFRDKQEYKIKLINEKVIELIVDDKKIPEADFYKYDSVLKKIFEQVKKDEEMSEMDRKAAERDKEQAEKDEIQAEKDRGQAEEDRKMAEEDRKQSVADQEQAEEERKQAEEDRKQSAEDRKQAEEDRKQSMADQEQAGEDRKQAEVDRKQAEEDRKLLKGLVEDLIKENIITHEKALTSLQLNETELSVNGKKLSEAVYQKFKAKYLKSPRTEIWYSNTIHQRGLSIKNRDGNQ